MTGIVTLLSDFGNHDTYVGQMKGVLLGLAPGARLVDLTHQVPPQDVLEGAFQLATAWRAFPIGTTHLAVVDPGVGTSRRAIALRFDGHSFVLPDNGLVSLVLAGRDADDVVSLATPARSSTTFHGRDVFAPAAAKLARGDALRTLGAPSDGADLVRLALPPISVATGLIRAPIVSIDHFGNGRTLLTREVLRRDRPGVVVRCGSFVVEGISRAYGEVAPGEPVALFGSHGGLELSLRNGSAASRYGIEVGAVVEVITV